MEFVQSTSRSGNQSDKSEENARQSPGGKSGTGKTGKTRTATASSLLKVQHSARLQCGESAGHGVGIGRGELASELWLRYLWKSLAFELLRPAVDIERSANGSNWYLSNNRISGWGYDNAGNVTAIQNMPRTYNYDAENRQTTATVNSVVTTYAYDGNRQRVGKTWNGQTTTFVYDAFGNLAAEYGGTTSTSGTQYLTPDHLGSTRLVTNSAGAVVQCYDYLPFGEEIGNGTAGRSASCFGNGSYPVAGGAANTEFTGQARDAESGLDFFLARYMSAAQGRFMSPDPLGAFVADPGNPQSWNMYSYVGNNPLVFVDPSGMFQDCPGGTVVNNQCVQSPPPDPGPA